MDHQKCVIRLCRIRHAAFNVSQQHWSNRACHASDGIGTCFEPTSQRNNACQIWMRKEISKSNSMGFEKPVVLSLRGSTYDDNMSQSNMTIAEILGVSHIGKRMSVHPWRFFLAIINPTLKNKWGTALHWLCIIFPHWILFIAYCKTIFRSMFLLQFSDYPFMAPVWAKRSLITPMNPIPNFQYQQRFGPQNEK